MVLVECGALVIGTELEAGNECSSRQVTVTVESGGKLYGLTATRAAKAIIAI